MPPARSCAIFRLILLPLDGTPFAEQAVPAAIGLARASDGRLLLAHVRLPPVPLGGASALGLPEVTLPDEPEEAALDYLHDVAARVGARANVPAECVLLEGDVPDALRQLASESGVDLIAVASHDRSALGRLLVGSIAERIVRDGGRPVLLVRKSEAQLAMEREADPESVDDPIRVPAAPFRRVLVPLDGSPPAEAVLDPALHLARASGAAVTLLTVRHPSDPADGVPRDYLARRAMSLRADGLEVDVLESANSNVVRGILLAASDVAADVIAMATHGRAGLLHRSVAADVVHSVLMPVLLVRSESAGA